MFIDKKIKGGWLLFCAAAGVDAPMLTLHLKREQYQVEPESYEIKMDKKFPKNKTTRHTKLVKRKMNSIELRSNSGNRRKFKSVMEFPAQSASAYSQWIDIYLALLSPKKEQCLLQYRRKWVGDRLVREASVWNLDTYAVPE